MDQDSLPAMGQLGQNLLSDNVGRRAFLLGASAAIAYRALGAARAWADDGVGDIKIGVPDAVTPVPNAAQPDIIDPDFAMRIVVRGTDPLENPSGPITTFGKLFDGTNTEPDQNTFVIFKNSPGGPSPNFDYGHRFLYQGHENANDLAFVTRINLDVTDPAHRITLLTPVGSNNKTGLNRIDGSTYNPFTNTLLITEENSVGVDGIGDVIQITTSWPPVANRLGAFFGRGGFEGVHPDDNGIIYLQEDIGGRTAPAGTLATIDGQPNIPLRSARQPNSFVYRYVPNNPARLEDGGKMQALQVIIDGTPVTFHDSTVPANVINDIIAPAQLKLHTPGTTWPAKWVTIHVSNKDDTTPFVATTAAKAAGATPFKRPENMAWLPDSKFRTFFFTATGDTDAPTGQVPQLAARGAWGSIFRVDMKDDNGRGKGKNGKLPSDDATISIFVLGDQEHNSFDNLAFANDSQLLAAEDRGDTLHDQLQQFDSVWAFDVKNKKTLRFIALGRDASAAGPGIEDNEPTGVFVSSGSPTQDEMLGTKDSLDDARGFFTQQHGDNNVFEFFRVRRGEGR
jgi:Bacterial protein of unknown function (DUF839)